MKPTRVRRYSSSDHLLFAEGLLMAPNPPDRVESDQKVMDSGGNRKSAGESSGNASDEHRV